MDKNSIISIEGIPFIIRFKTAPTKIAVAAYFAY